MKDLYQSHLMRYNGIYFNTFTLCIHRNVPYILQSIHKASCFFFIIFHFHMSFFFSHSLKCIATKPLLLIVTKLNFIALFDTYILDKFNKSMNITTLFLFYRFFSAKIEICSLVKEQENYNINL